MNIILILMLLFNTLITDIIHLCDFCFLDSCESADMIVVGKVIDYDVFVKYNDKENTYPTVLVLEVIEIIAKNDSIYWNRPLIKTKKIFRILGYSKGNNGKNVQFFPKGSLWIFNLHNSFNKTYDINFFIDECSSSYLKILNNKAIGNIDGRNIDYYNQDAVSEMDLDSLKTRILEIRSKKNKPND